MVSTRILGGVLGAAAVACAPSAPRFPDAASDGTSTSVASDDAGSTAISDAETFSSSSSDDGIVDDTARGTDTSSTTGASLETTAASDDTTSTTDTGPSPTEPYGPCPAGDTDCPRGTICIELMQEDAVLATACGEPCMGDDTCESFGMGDMPVCLPLVMGAACALSCDDGSLCPPGMECTATAAGSVCMWPSGMG